MSLVSPTRTSAKRLAVTTWSPPGGDVGHDQFPSVPTVDSAMRRVVLLEQLGMDAEARFEYDALEASATTSVDRLLTTANVLRAHGQTSRAIRLAWKLVERGQLDLDRGIFDRGLLNRGLAHHRICCHGFAAGSILR